MNGTCQTCGTVAPIEWFMADTEYRRICAILVELPKDVQPVVFHYLGLFRPVTGRAMQAKKATRLLSEIKALVAAGHVQVDRKVARPCPPRLWAQAIEQMIERRDRLSLPMPNHQYLMKIAWDLADQADAAAEQQSRTQRVTRAASPGPVASIQSPLDAYVQGLRDTKPSDVEMADWNAKRMQQ